MMKNVIFFSLASLLLLAGNAFAFDPLFYARIDYGAGGGPRSVFAVDLDGDGDNDMAVANGGSDDISILINLSNTTGVDNSPETYLPGSFNISQNYPNPFNASATIKYELPQQAHVTIEIYDLLGRRVETLASEKQPVGYHQITWDATGHSSGIYFYRIQTAEYAETKKMVFLR